MTTKYGYEQHEWDAAKAGMREAQVERANVWGMIPYSERVEKITTIELDTHGSSTPEGESRSRRSNYRPHVPY